MTDWTIKKAKQHQEFELKMKAKNYQKLNFNEILRKS